MYNSYLFYSCLSWLRQSMNSHSKHTIMAKSFSSLNKEQITKLFTIRDKCIKMPWDTVVGYSGLVV